MVGAIAALVISVLCGATGFLPLLSFTVSGFALVTTIREMTEPASVRAKRKSESFLRAFWAVSLSTRRRFGGYIVHIGVIMIAVAVTGSSAFKQQSEYVLTPGQEITVEQYRLSYVEDRTEEQPHRLSRMAVIKVHRGDSYVGELTPRLNNYFRMGSVIGTPAVKTSLDEDLYLNLVKMDEDGKRIGLQVIIEPLIFWLWLGLWRRSWFSRG